MLQQSLRPALAVLEKVLRKNPHSFKESVTTNNSDLDTATAKKHCSALVVALIWFVMTAKQKIQVFLCVLRTLNAF